MLTDLVQLGLALKAFGWAHKMSGEWAQQTLSHCEESGITSISDLAIGCREKTINLDFELFGIQEQLSDKTIKFLQNFLPGPVGVRCFRLAQKAAEKVEKGTADTLYVHRPESGRQGKEQWTLPVGDDWTLHVDCAGFIRNCLKHVTKNPFQMILSDRDFMRAKDFFAFFSTIPYTVMDDQPAMPESDKQMKWRLVPDLRMVIPGDIIVYRPKGNAAGGAAFTTNDRKDLNHLLRAVKTAQLYHRYEHDWTDLRARNYAKDPRVKPWVGSVKAKLKAIGVTRIKDLRENLETINDTLRKHGYQTFYQDTLELMKECLETRAMNTGHIVFCSGRATDLGNGEYRVRVVHSTKYGEKDENGQITTGVQEYFRRFQLVETSSGEAFWTREMHKAPCPADEEENPTDDMEEDTTNPIEPDEEEAAEEEVLDDLAGVGEVEVLVARMSF